MPAPLVGAAVAAAARLAAKKVGQEAAKKSAKKAAAKTDPTAALKKSGIEKLTKLNKTTSEAHILSAVRQGKITAKEAAAIDPKKFGILVNPKIVSSKTIKLK
jgi:hypothetical protein